MSGAQAQDPKRISLEMIDQTGLDVPGRLMVPSGEETTCSVTRITADDMHVACQLSVTPGDRVIVYLEALGRVEGTVSGLGSGSFALKTDLQVRQLERLTERLGEFLESRKSGIERRQAIRREPTAAELQENTRMKTDSNVEVPCTVLDISVTGAHLETGTRPPIGANIFVGRMTGRIVRHTTQGVGIEFIKSATGALSGPSFAY